MNKKDRILIIAISVLIIVIVVLAVVIIINISKSIGKERKYSETNNIKEKQATSKEAMTTINILAFGEGKYTLDGLTEDNIFEEGGVQLEITKLSEEKVSFSYMTISSPPANRIAMIEMEDVDIIDGKAKFTFDDDGWFNRGTGFIQFNSDGKIDVHIDITMMDSEAMWDIGAGVQGLSLLK